MLPPAGNTILPGRTVAGILVGGESRRMGRDKALLPHPENGTFLRHVAKVARACADEVVLLGDRPDSLLPLRCLPDAAPQAGPLGGLSSLLAYVGDGWGLLLSCDLPMLQEHVLRHLLAARRPDLDAVAYRTAPGAETLQACCALYHTRAKPTVERHLTGKGAVQDVLRELHVRILEPDTRQCRALANPNTPAELAALGLFPE